MRTARHVWFLLLLAALPLVDGCVPAVVVGVVVVADVAHDRRSADTIVADRNLQLSILDKLDRDPDLVRGNYRVKVVVYDHYVLLCGQAASAELKQRAENIATGFEGVKRVMNEIDVTDTPQGFWSRRGDNTMTARVKTALLDVTSIPGFDPTRVNVTTSNHVVYMMGFVNHEEADAAASVARDIDGVAKVVKVFEYAD
jgi:osmotically-inducible protein OsmY